MQSKRFSLTHVAKSVLIGCAAAVAQAETPTAATNPVPEIFNSDIAVGCDDALAFAMLHAFTDRGECRIEAVTISRINLLTAQFVDAVNTSCRVGSNPPTN